MPVSTVSRRGLALLLLCFFLWPRSRLFSGLIPIPQAWSMAPDRQPVMPRQAVSPTKTWLGDASQMGATPPCRAQNNCSATVRNTDPVLQMRHSMEKAYDKSWPDPDLDCQSIRSHHVGTTSSRPAGSASRYALISTFAPSRRRHVIDSCAVHELGHPGDLLDTKYQPRASSSSLRVTPFLFMR